MAFSTFLDGQSVTQLQGLAFLGLSDSGNVLNLGGTANQGGGIARSWTTGSTIPCRVDPIGGRESEIAGRVSDRSTHRITVPPETSIGTEDRFAISSRGTFEITAIRKRTNEWVRVLEAVEL